MALDEGFTYLVSGSGSAEDYGSVSMESLEGIMDYIVHKRNGDVRRERHHDHAYEWNGHAHTVCAGCC